MNQYNSPSAKNLQRVMAGVAERNPDAPVFVEVRNIFAPQANGHTRLQEFLDVLNAKHGGVGGGNGSFITGLPGDRYVRIIHANGGNSAYAFIEIATGNILKPASWKSPAKHARGNIFASDLGLSACGRYSVAYLSGGRS